MSSLLYVSGPSCSGKTTLSRMILEKRPEYRYLPGDPHWIASEHQDFRGRVLATHHALLMELDHTESDHILVEWVPTSGSFVDELALICRRSDRHFFQIILNASDQVLRSRKMMRDGDADTRSSSIGDQVDGDMVVALDTTDVAADQVLDAVLDRVGNRWASWTPLRTAALGDSRYRTMSSR